MHIVKEIGRHMPGGYFICKAAEPEVLFLTLEKLIF